MPLGDVAVVVDGRIVIPSLGVGADGASGLYLDAAHSERPPAALTRSGWRAGCKSLAPKEDAMKTIGLCLLVAGAVGCASSTELENKSRIHSLRADAAASARDYEVAAKEQDKARDLHAKAVEKAYKEGRATEVEVPADVPAVPTP